MHELLLKLKPAAQLLQTLVLTVEFGLVQVVQLLEHPRQNEVLNSK